MSDIAIRVESLGKQYRIGKRERYKTLRDTLTDTASAPFRWARSMVSASARAEATTTSELFWALKDVSFEVPQGSVVGVIGRNGAGKSTLLKVLSRITEPTEGCVEIHGRVGSLLEVGTGFHPELTGRENVFLNGAILGMRRAEITSKFDEIVAFAEVDKFIDTPVKHYSSGMYMRLAFAVAAHLDPEILVIDEVLAVGDAQFQKKCLGKMGDVAKQGRTVLFVSHNLPVIQALCSEVVVLNSGRVQVTGSTGDGIQAYMDVDAQKLSLTRAPRADAAATVTGVHIESVEAREQTKIRVQCELYAISQMTCSMEVKLFDGVGTPIGIAEIGLADSASLIDLRPGRELVTGRLTLPRMASGMYRLSVQLTVPLVRIIDSTGDGIVFEVRPEPVEGHQRAIEWGWGCGSFEIPLEIARTRVEDPECEATLV
jgi:lipopolysaccharide transport system ATP-binding protein